MKNYIIKLIIIVCLTLSLFSCRYEDGPLVSFRTPSQRIEGIYDIEKFEVGGADSTEVFKSKQCYTYLNFSCENDKKALFDYPSNTCIVNGYWTLTDFARKIKITFIGFYPALGPWGGSYNTNTWEIDLLKDDEMTLSKKSNSIHYKIKLKEI